MDFKKKIATALTATTLSLVPNFAQGAEKKAVQELYKGPASIVIPGLAQKAQKNVTETSSAKKSDLAVLPETKKTKSLPKTAKVGSNCKGVVYDNYRFGPVYENSVQTSKFGSVVKIPENLSVKCAAEKGITFGNYKEMVESALLGQYGAKWGDLRYSVGKDGKNSTPIFKDISSTGLAALISNKYANKKLDNLAVYSLNGQVLPKEEIKSPMQIRREQISTLDLTSKQNDTRVSKGTYKFDIDGNGKPNELDLIDKSGRIYVIDKENGTLLREMPLDNVRYEVLSNIRNVQGGQTDAMRGYLMTAKKQGEEVIRFIVDTNKDANKTLNSDAYVPTEQTKFANLEGLVTFMDKVANLSERADQIDAKVLKYIDDGKIKVDTKQLDMKAYSSTFGEEVPTGLVVLYFTAGSAIYTVLSSDYLPTVKGSDVMSQVRGSRDAVNLDMLLTTHKHNGNLSQTAVNAYTQTKSMYNAQFKASEKRVTEVKF